MVDRHDIDALLIGSLYGELSSADEARLNAHLESHPGDRSALDGLLRTRDAVRASRIFEVQLEPSQSVSALLLQEAARRAPRKARQEEASEGWFARLRRSFLMSPAFAAAAMLVVVVGVAGTIYKRQGDHFAAPQVSRESAGAAADQAEQAAGSGFAAAPMAPAAPAPESPAFATPPAGGALGQGQVESKPGAELAKVTGSTERGARRDQDAYRVGVADDDSARLERQAKADNRQLDGAFATAPSPASRPPADAPKAEKAADKKKAVLEVTTPQRAPKDLEADVRPKAAKGRAQSEEAKPAESAPAADPAPRNNVTATPPAVRAPGGAPAPAPAATGGVRDVTKAPAGPSGGGAGGATVPAAGAGGEDKVDANLAWARDQHSRLITQVRAGRCTDAAGTAVSLSSRAPSYYQQNVENDRDLKACLPYINAERERAAEKAQRARATTRRVTSDEAADRSAPKQGQGKTTPAKAAPPKAAPVTKTQ